MTIPPTGGESPLENDAAPRRRRRARRHTPARRFTGVGRHGGGDQEAVLAALAAAQELADPQPMPVAPVDEFDLPHEPKPKEPALTPLSAEEVRTEADHQAWLEAAEHEADQVEHAGGGFADALARYGDVPVGYLPATDLFADESVEVDLQAHRRRRRRRTMTITTALLVVLLALGVGGWYLLRQFTAPPADYPGPGSGTVSFQIQSGWGTKQIAKSLVDAGVVKSTAAFENAAKDGDANYHPGTFTLMKEMTAADAFTALTNPEKSKVSYFSLPANTRMVDALKLISEGTGLKAAQLEALSKTPATFGLPSSVKSLEGYLHPGEYRVPQGTDAKTVLQTLVDATTATLEKEGVTDPLEQYRYLKIASIVAGEAQQKDFKHVAGIIDNRLSPNNKETGGRLDVDSSVSYGLGQVSIHLTKEQKADKSNAYNSYQHAGLPPTPIGSPGARAIAAAVHPDKSDDYYWVTVNLSTGETRFAKTYAEHLKNVDVYRAWCSANQDVCK